MSSELEEVIKKELVDLIVISLKENKIEALEAQQTSAAFLDAGTFTSDEQLLQTLEKLGKQYPLLQEVYKNHAPVIEPSAVLGTNIKTSQPVLTSICWNCKALNSSDSQNCTNCGQKLIKQQPTEQTAEQKPQTIQEQEIAKKRKDGIIGGIVVSVVFIIIYIIIAQWVGIIGFLVLAGIIGLILYSVLSKPKTPTATSLDQTSKPETSTASGKIQQRDEKTTFTLASSPVQTTLQETTKKESSQEPINETHARIQKELREAPTYDDLVKQVSEPQPITSPASLPAKKKAPTWEDLEKKLDDPNRSASNPMEIANMFHTLISSSIEEAEEEERQAKQQEEEEAKGGVSVFGKAVETSNVVSISQKKRRQGLYIIGVNGTGKSTLIANLIVQDIEQGLGLCLLDPHGDLTNEVLSRVPENRVGDVIVLDLMDSSFPFGLNIFECPDPSDLEQVALTAGFVMHVFEKVWNVGTETPLLSQFLRNISYTLIQNPDTTLAEIPLLLQDETTRDKLVSKVQNMQVRLFWQTYNKLRASEQLERSSSTLNKADAFLTQPIIANIVGQSKTTLNFREIMDKGKILLVQLNPRLEDISNLIGSVIIGQMLNAALSRKDVAESERKQFNLYADEYQRFATEDFAILLSEARKFGIATTIAHQYLDQLDSANRGASVNAANLAVFRVSGQDSTELAKEFDSTPPPPEIIGQKPIYSPKRDVVDHLIKNGHKNPTINSFTSTYLVHLDDVLTRYATKSRIDWTDETSFFEQGYLEVEDLREGINELNNTLYACMVDHNANKPISPYTLLAASFCFKFTQGVGLSGGMMGGGYNVELKNRLKPKQITLDFCQPNVFSNLENLKSQIGKQDKFNQAIAFLRSLRSAMEALAIDPILVDTGQHEPVYDKPRAYADMQNEIATRLTNLPNHRAKVKTIGKEYLIDTVLPKPGITSDLLIARREKVREQTRNLYCRGRQVVEVEVMKRQEKLLQISPPKRSE